MDLEVGVKPVFMQLVRSVAWDKKGTNAGIATDSVVASAPRASL